MTGGDVVNDRAPPGGRTESPGGRECRPLRNTHILSLLGRLVPEHVPSGEPRSQHLGAGGGNEPPGSLSGGPSGPESSWVISNLIPQLLGVLPTSPRSPALLVHKGAEGPALGTTQDHSAGPPQRGHWRPSAATIPGVLRNVPDARLHGSVRCPQKPGPAHTEPVCETQAEGRRDTLTPVPTGRTRARSTDPGLGSPWSTGGLQLKRQTQGTRRTRSGCREGTRGKDPEERSLATWTGAAGALWKHDGRGPRALK